MPSTKTGYAPVENGDLYYEVTGEGSALLLMHAGVADLTMWEPQIEPFSQSHKVITYDMRGFGRSRTESASFSNQQDVRDLLQHLGVQKAILVGNSRAGSIAVDTALEFPEIVSALVWICGGVSGLDHEPTQEEIDWFGKLGALEEAREWDTLSDLEAHTWADGVGQPEGRAPAHVRQKVRDMIYNNYIRQDGEGKPRILQPLAARRLEEIKVPMLVVIGDLDTSGTQASAELLARDVPNARKVVFHNVAHMVGMEKPEEFNALVQDFLADNNL